MLTFADVNVMSQHRSLMTVLTFNFATRFIDTLIKVIFNDCILQKINMYFCLLSQFSMSAKQTPNSQASS